ncbi:MAG: hypothetical protein AB8B48_19915 [Pseudomonadales bacterium]
MATLKEWFGDAEQRLMTSLINRTCKKSPNLLDRIAMRLLKKMIGEVPHDPELDHPESG